MKRRFLLFLAVMLLNVMAALGQTKISGTVVFQDDGEPVIGASVLVEGNKAGTITNIDGEFTLEVPAGKKIQVSYVGMETQTLTPKPGMKIALKNNTTIEEVVVTGMSKMDRRTFTGATDKVDAKDAILGGVADVSRSLEGRSAGVSVQNV